MAATVELDDRGIVVACSSCGQKNRLMYDRLGDEVRCGQCKTALALPGSPIEIRSTADFDRLVARAAIPVVVDYWAPWCGPCRMVAPELGERFNIRSIPTLAVFAGGKEVSRAAGARPADQIEAFISQATPVPRS
jgi:thioredoxin 2